jgi:hypothetical protein
MDDFNYRLKLLEKPPIKNQQRKVAFELNTNQIKSSNEDLRF